MMSIVDSVTKLTKSSALGAQVASSMGTQLQHAGCSRVKHSSAHCPQMLIAQNCKLRDMTCHDTTAYRLTIADDHESR